MAGRSRPGSGRRSASPASFLDTQPENEHPPSKRARGCSAGLGPDTEDPFGEHGELTADDLEELDVLASQALSQCRAEARDMSSVYKVYRFDEMPKSPAGKNRENTPVNDNCQFEVLQTQYKELEKKLKTMEEEILVKNGEIKILRDSLFQTELVLEEQRRAQFLLEQEKSQVLSEKEKEFSKKLQSLQSELQFKDAEMNELRTKLQNSERANKLASPSISHVSPRKNPSVVVKPEACSPQFGRTPFPTKESFNANMSIPHQCQTEQRYKSVSRQDKTQGLRMDPIKLEAQQERLADSLLQRSNIQGSILINLLLKQPLVPGSSLGLCYLLSSCSETPAGTFMKPPGLGNTLARISGLRTPGGPSGSFSPSILREAQSLAFAGLNLIARNEDSPDDSSAEESQRTFPLCQLPGAIYLLPLVHFFLTLHCQALQDVAAARRSRVPGDSPTRAPCARSSGGEASPEDLMCSVEGLCVASLSILHHLVCHSRAVVCLLLSGMGEGNGSWVHRLSCADMTSAPRGSADHSGQHPLLKILLHLVTFSSTPAGSLQVNVLSKCLKVLAKLAENASSDCLPRLQCVLAVLPPCLSPQTPLPCVLLAVELLAQIADSDGLVQQFCSHSERCLLLLLYSYITSKPDKAASQTQWLQLEQETVWLLAKLGMQTSCSPFTGSDCQCSVEVVRALTVVLHQQWLTVRRAGAAFKTNQQKRTVRCLRDAVLLLHSVSQKDKLFSVHCVEVLHQYDQVMPGVSTLIRALPDVTDCEEAALDDLCATEADMEDTEMDCA
ncbi:ATR-interacting protein isoform X1 [Dipodomys spectabilis]|uniref:ATR-interacting protein isoform X1 n=1 Tax=Dipodomys spectabilis TaxID=105255 RepID=UPI001C547A57|nr:ATR-interacting protein isoform X1 [Dipodomys spectabilis]